MKVVITVKLNQQKEILISRLLKIPLVQKCEIVGKTADGFLAQVELEDGYEFQIDAYITKESYPIQIAELAQKMEQSERGRYYVIMAPYISETTAKICVEKGIGYFDYVGNCLFQMHSLYIHEKGNKNIQSQKRGQKSIFEKSSVVSSLILREIFEDLEKCWKLKHLSEKIGCSIGQVSKVKEFLCRNMWAEMTKNGLKITKPEEILHAWQEVYGKKELERYACYSLDTPASFEQKLAEMKRDHAIEYYLTGFSGGVRYAPVVRYNKVHVFIEPESIKEAIEFLECRQVDTGANIMIYPLDEISYQAGSQIKDGVSVVSPIQVYLDCMQLKGRGEELAEAVMEREILK